MIGRCSKCSSSYTASAIGFNCSTVQLWGECCGAITGEELPKRAASPREHVGASPQSFQGVAARADIAPGDGLTAREAALKDMFNASEKERARLMAQLNEKTPHVDPMTGVCTGCGTSRIERAAQDCFRRELENLKRSTASELGDLRGLLNTVEQHRDELYDRERFLQRELDRERGKRKRGL